MNISITGFDEFQNNLNNFLENAKKLDGQEVPFTELFSPMFMSQHTDASSFDELLQKSGLKIETPEDLLNIPEQEMDSLVAEHTKFPTWDAMQIKAFEEWSAQQPGF